MSDFAAKPSNTEEKRVSTLAGDRLCTKCGYNLTGQAVVREPHYDMLMVRCSECGSVASIQEYPLLGRWAGRWAMLIAAAWFALLIIFLVATSGLLFNFGLRFTSNAIYPYAMNIAELHVQWHKSLDTTTQQQQIQYQMYDRAFPFKNIDQTWWSTQDPQVLLAQAGGWSKAAQWPSTNIWGSIVVFVFLSGCFWAVLLAHLRRIWLTLFGILLIAFAALFGALYYYYDYYSMSLWGWFTAQDIANEQLGMIYYGIAISGMSIPLTLGLLLGRPVVRLLIRTLLPPRLRNWLAFLWITDGLEPPK